MREILFKAKRIDNGEWVEGALLDGEKYCLIGQEIKFSPYTENECKIVGFKVDRNPICQYTGLCDKNGNKIWENDVCSVSLILEDRMEKENCVVRYGRRAEFFRIELGFNVEWTKTDYLRCDICFWTENREVVVIGNIFDNPELFGGGE